jgi:myo-inositol 2-dehydrogenase/D-chiro-inositol 1-dehydrogenase
MAPAFRLGLAGAGRMGRTHLRALAVSGQVTVTAIAEPSAPSRAALASTGPAVYECLAAMLDGAALDGVLVAAPSDRHEQVIREIAARGLPILCEKPCGLNSAQASAAAQAASAAGVALQVAYWRRYVPARILGGELGSVHLVSCYQWDEQPPGAGFRAHSGGIFVDMGVHEFDQLRWLTGQDIGPLTGAAATLACDPAVSGDVDSAELLLSLSGGTVGLVSLGRHHPAGDMARAEVFGTDGTARCDFLDPADGEQAQLSALAAQAEDFAAMARGGRGSGATAADAVAALEAAERASAAIPALAAAG